MAYEKIRELVAVQFAVNEDSIMRETIFIDDLGADSLDIVELTMALEEEFAIPEVLEEDLKEIVTVGDLVDYVSSLIND